MKKVMVSDFITQYVHEPRKNYKFEDNIYAIIHDKKAILIDVGYEDEAKLVLEDLNTQGISLEGVIISHFHDDHMWGLKALPKVPIYGSHHCKDTLSLWTPKEDHKYYEPTNPIHQASVIEFGPHTIELIPWPGHSACELLVNIDDTYVHVGDELMMTITDEPLLPCLSFKKETKRQYDSLQRLKGYKNHTVLMGHGKPLIEENRILQEINDVCYYLDAIYSNDTEITYEEAARKCSRDFVGHWHKNIYRNS